jgi:hypothetical protein
MEQQDSLNLLKLKGYVAMTRCDYLCPKDQILCQFCIKESKASGSESTHEKHTRSSQALVFNIIALKEALEHLSKLTEVWTTLQHKCLYQVPSCCALLVIVQPSFVLLLTIECTVGITDSGRC